MTKEQKLLISTSLLPVLADMLEDCEFNRLFKVEANKIINHIRTFDKMLLNGAEKDEYEQQNNIQLAFRQWITKTMEDDNTAEN